MTSMDEVRPGVGAVAGWQSAMNSGEQRGAPRVDLIVPVAFRNGVGQHCAARLSNLSVDGLQVRCNVATAQTIHPRGGRLGPDNQPLLHATAVLPLADGPQTLSIGVRLIYCRPDDRGPDCVLGFRFLELRPRARRLIEAFFTEQFGTSMIARDDDSRAA